jgi:hypothetical protein
MVLPDGTARCWQTRLSLHSSCRLIRCISAEHLDQFRHTARQGRSSDLLPEPALKGYDRPLDGIFKHLKATGSSLRAPPPVQRKIAENARMYWVYCNIQRIIRSSRSSLAVLPKIGAQSELHPRRGGDAFPFSSPDCAATLARWRGASVALIRGIIPL